MTTHLMMTIEGLTGTLVSSEYNRLARFSPELLELVTSLVTRAAERVETAVRKEMEEDAREAAEDAAEAARAEAEEAAEAEEDDRFGATCPDCGLEFIVDRNEDEEEEDPA